MYRYSEEFKKKIVKECQGKVFKDFSKEKNISLASMKRWRKKYGKHKSKPPTDDKAVQCCLSLSSSEEDDVEKQDDKEWSKENLHELISRMLAQIGSSDHLQYKSGLKKMPWDEVAFHYFTAKDCKHKWLSLSKKVRRFRTLTDLVLDVQYDLLEQCEEEARKNNGLPKQPLPPPVQYFLEKQLAFSALHPNLTRPRVFTQLQKKYEALPQEKKEKYIQAWKKETEEFNDAMKKIEDENSPSMEAEAVSATSLPPPQDQTKSNTSSQPQVDPEERQNSLKKRRNRYTKRRVVSKKLPKVQEQSKAPLAKSTKEVLKKTTLAKRKKEVLKKTDLAKSTKEVLKKTDLAKSKNEVLKKTDLAKNKNEVLKKTAFVETNPKSNGYDAGKLNKIPINGYNLFCMETMSTLTEMSNQARHVECARLWKLATDQQKQNYHRRYLALKEEHERNNRKVSSLKQRSKSTDSNGSNKSLTALSLEPATKQNNDDESSEVDSSDEGSDASDGSSDASDESSDASDDDSDGSDEDSDSSESSSYSSHREDKDEGDAVAEEDNNKDGSVRAEEDFECQVENPKHLAEETANSPESHKQDGREGVSVENDESCNERVLPIEKDKVNLKEKSLPLSSHKKPTDNEGSPIHHAGDALPYHDDTHSHNDEHMEYSNDRERGKRKRDSAEEIHNHRFPENTNQSKRRKVSNSTQRSEKPIRASPAKPSNAYKANKSITEDNKEERRETEVSGRWEREARDLTSSEDESDSEDGLDGSSGSFPSSSDDSTWSPSE